MDAMENMSLDELEALWVTFNQNDSEPINSELECHFEQLRASTTLDPKLFCPPVWDSLLCWPKTSVDSLVEQPCFAELNGIKYDITKNASRWCNQNGTWDRYVNYSGCTNVEITSRDPYIPGFEDAGVEITSYIYFFGYTISMIALMMAVTIFIYFKDLQCLRNTIHTNLMFTFIFTDFMWILTLILEFNVQSDITWCVVLIILLHYFHLTNFFWMFVEGLYLYMMVVETFSVDNMKLSFYITIGWGLPSIFIIIWTIAKSFKSVLEYTDSTLTISNDPDDLLKHCPWMTPHALDWIFQGPAIIVLATNFVFMCRVMWVLITKLRSTNSIETQQYRKATKALVILIPLLGITYILVIGSPGEGGISKKVYEAVRALLISTQGFSVALFYCFLNGDVQTAIKHYIDLWKEKREIEGKRRKASKDWSRKSRSESIRLCINPPLKRESTSSGTTTTLLGSSMSSCHRIGSRSQSLQDSGHSVG